jgi:hypothetical protein
MVASQRFEFAFNPTYERVARLFGISPQTAWVELTGVYLHARYGRWMVQTPLYNIASVEVTGPYRFFKTAGPPRLGVTDAGLTFASNGDRGVLIEFRQKVPGIEPLGILRHPELTVTVAEPEDLAATLRAAAGLDSTGNGTGPA